jgi:hypothetical protein
MQDFRKSVFVLKEIGRFFGPWMDVGVGGLVGHGGCRPSD